MLLALSMLQKRSPWTTYLLHVTKLVQCALNHHSALELRSAIVNSELGCYLVGMSV